MTKRKPKDRRGMTNNELRVEIATRANPDLFMDVFELVRIVSRAGLLSILDSMDLDDNMGTFGPIRRRPLS